ncbi:hypothetical protein MGG_00870 [Pyricularia oryzae 70-15]|uniref:Uncharacterized protein n=1 Tax=Pyricularia oryzae (strain 70-15 / ATCC MYA-4617 / FGSC 8958) TaxID=242507 RepID=G4NDT0_PYRO7|nr:uncharacterized protein MGG_00870 [Pyricularia oryzae 70-15]EHA48518.1 hypothetical protein MGG_00870 [Pyricularia oryzae 70-15]
MDTVVQEALCDQNWVHNPAKWGIAFFSPDSTGWLDLTVEMRNALRANFSWKQIALATTEDELSQSGELGNTADSTASTLDQKTKTSVTRTRRFEMELTLLRTGPHQPPEIKGLVERAFRPRRLAVRLSEGRFPRQHPYLGIVQVFGWRLVFEPSVFPDLEDWTDEYSRMVTAGKFHEWKSFYSGALDDFELTLAAKAAGNPINTKVRKDSQAWVEGETQKYRCLKDVRNKGEKQNTIPLLILQPELSAEDPLFWLTALGLTGGGFENFTSWSDV